jgi:type IV pilus assembly protein PilB
MSDLSQQAHILSIDDDPDIRDLIERSIQAAGYEVDSAADGEKGINHALAHPPALILLDVMMPKMDGYEVCARLQAEPSLSDVPVVFLTALGDDQDKAKAFALGAVDYVVKPFRPAELIDVIHTHLQTSVRWRELATAVEDWQERLAPSDFVSFRDKLVAQAGLSGEARAILSVMRPDDMYAAAQKAGVGQAEMGQMLADHLGIPRVTVIDPKEIDLAALPAPFCRKNLVVPIHSGTKRGLVVANPFNFELLDTIRHFSTSGTEFALSVAEPRVIMALLTGANEAASERVSHADSVHSFADSEVTELRQSVDAVDEDDEDSGPVTYIANNMIVAAVQQRASDIHIEPKENTTIVRFRVDGELRDFVTLKRATAAMLISKLKALAGLDIAERRKPQDGSLDADIAGGRYKLRLATTSTPEGESLIMRLLEITATAKPLTELGLSKSQSDKLEGYAQRGNGLVLIVGMTGSGKTTTIYSLISTVDGTKRSILTIEDPVEYRIPLANQQQVNEKAGVSFESLLRSVVRQDPDVLFLGEIRDSYSAKMAMDFASTGHLTITTLHTTNATTAFFRLERLGVSRGVMAEALLCIVAQRLVKRLCPSCRSIDPISDQERAWLAPFTDDVPATVAHPVGCAACNGTGYMGREAVDEIIDFGGEIQSMVRNGASVAEIRKFQRSRGDYLMYDHAIEKVRNHTVAPIDIYEKVLVEELDAMHDEARERDQAEESARIAAPVAAAPVPPLAPAAPLTTPPEVPVHFEAAPATAVPASTAPTRILVVEDDEDARAHVQRVLQDAGYEVGTAPDGATALMLLGRADFDLLVADIRMPLLDGFAMLEVMGQQSITTPVIMLTGSDQPEDEARGLGLGAADYIHKPVRPDVLKARVERVLASTAKGRA